MDTSGPYRAVTGFAASAPVWVQRTFELWTGYGLWLFGVLLAAVWWRARGRGGARAVALALLAPAATAVAHVVSEAVKSTVEEERPCRAVAGAAAPLIGCPPPGDWSFPSNHAAIAGGAAVALVMAVRRLAPLVVPLALLMAFSRVFVGVHYPHDVALGLLLGGSVAALLVLALTGPLASGVRAVREGGAGAGGSRPGGIRAVIRAGGIRAGIRLTGPGPGGESAPEVRNVPGCRMP
ncbi:phosphatase PAP2 family protein [Streptomyces sp. A0592]|uniref:phosphatase PAP2 family protein n=1 Tax=Streptomyces sp. A0592 TaxID=2563099 RepID=UPI00109E56C5|nr:phosphatase PAP2 family protein [Streptomyces sp. A0592]THA75153.1 phosphatase PAP2 family protein [Streptomyces sp. A0592]